jgi:hypothetical protein
MFLVSGFQFVVVGFVELATGDWRLGTFLKTAKITFGLAFEKLPIPKPFTFYPCLICCENPFF